jgi:hypothetical protein
MTTETEKLEKSVWTFIEWADEELCEYNCMTKITELRTENGFSVLKYYGHWPFKRYLGFEEPASALFSLFNAFPHFHFLVKMIKTNYKNKTKYFMHSWLVLYAILAINTWMSSAIYHAKKTSFSTLYDYLSAVIFLSHGLFLSIRRLIGIVNHQHQIMSFIIYGIILILLVFRCTKMIRGEISYDQHMQLCIYIVIFTCIIWIYSILFTMKQDPTIHMKSIFDSNKFYCFICQFGFILASCFELFDFPPYFKLFDAHSIWHFATIPLGYLWYTFWEKDEEYYYVTQLQSKKI